MVGFALPGLAHPTGGGKRVSWAVRGSDGASPSQEEENMSFGSGRYVGKYIYNNPIHLVVHPASRPVTPFTGFPRFAGRPRKRGRPPLFRGGRRTAGVCRQSTHLPDAPLRLRGFKSCHLDLISAKAHRRFWRWAFSLKCAALRAIPARFNLLHTLPGFFSGVVAKAFPYGSSCGSNDRFFG